MLLKGCMRSNAHDHERESMALEELASKRRALACVMGERAASDRVARLSERLERSANRAQIRAELLRLKVVATVVAA